MNIQGLGKSIQAGNPSQQSDPRIKSLDRQITELQKRIQEVRKNEKLDPKVKSEKIKEYEEQIQLLQQQKAQIQAEERQNRQKPAENGHSSVNGELKADNNTIDEDIQNAFVKMDSLKESERAIGVVREQAKGELRIAESKSFRHRPGSTPAAAAKARGKLDKMDRDMYHKAGEIVEGINESSDVAKESAVSSKDRLAEEESDRERPKRGTGRMEPGQFLDDEA